MHLRRGWLFGALFLLLVPACKKKVPPPPPPVAPAPVAVTPTLLERGKELFRQGDYAGAIPLLIDHLAQGGGEQGDEALYYLALSHALAQEGMERGVPYLEQLIREFPQSDFRVPAELLLGLYRQTMDLRRSVSEREAQVRRLSQELEKLKAIDLQRRPRPPDG